MMAAVRANLLLVEDDERIRTSLRLVLEDEGHAVRVAADGESGLRALEDHAPDCMVVDVMMPGLDGFGVLRVRRERRLAPWARVVLLTAKSAERDFSRGWELGADYYMLKPFDGDELLDRVEELLRCSPEELADRRRAEQDKSVLLQRVEAAFSRPSPRRRLMPGG